MINLLNSCAFKTNAQKQRSLTGLEKLVNHVFVENEYNPLVRPLSFTTGKTEVSTELKILQLNLVRILLEINLYIKLFSNSIAKLERKKPRVSNYSMARDGN